MSDALTIPEELTRKALDHLENSYLALERGEIGMLEFKAIVETLFAICSGLTDREFFEIISQASAEIKADQSFIRYRLFENSDDHGYLIMYRSDRPCIDIVSFDIKGRKNIDCEVHKISENVSKVVKSLKDRGYFDENLRGD